MRRTGSSDQMMLEGFEPPKPTDNLFFALLPDEAAAQRLAAQGEALRASHRLYGALQSSRLHVSLLGFKPMYRWSPEKAALAERMGDAARFPSFEVRFDRALSFAGRSSNGGRKIPYVLRAAEGNPGVVGLSYVLAGGAARGEVTPHLTLLYDERIVAEHEIEPIGWIAREFALVRNRIGTGLPYEVLKRWPLIGA
jgi:2'-5' RNA ligase